MKFLSFRPTTTLHKHSRAQGKAVQAERGILFEIQLISLVLKQPQSQQEQDTGPHCSAQRHSERTRDTSKALQISSGADFGWPPQDPL